MKIRPAVARDGTVQIPTVWSALALLALSDGHDQAEDAARELARQVLAAAEPAPPRPDGRQIEQNIAEALERLKGAIPKPREEEPWAPSSTS